MEERRGLALHAGEATIQQQGEELKVTVALRHVYFISLHESHHFRF